MSKQHGKRGDNAHGQQATTDDEQRSQTVGKRMADEQAADAVARRMATVEGDDSGMIVDDASAQRAQLLDRANAYVDAVVMAVDKFQAILRQRHAEATIEKKIGWKAAGEKFKEKAIELLNDKLREGVKQLGEASELAPGIGGVIKAVGKVKCVVDDNEKAEQAEAEVESVDSIVIAMERTCSAARKTATGRLSEASPEELARWTAEPTRPPNQAEIVAQLDAILLQAMRDSGTQTVNQQLDALKGREKLGEEIESVDKTWDKTRSAE